MFTKIHKTNFPPSQPTLVWDGECKFCRWWKSRWELKTWENIRFLTYQEVAGEFPDIPPKKFKKASRLIESDGRIYSGPDSAYRSLYLSGNNKWHCWYHQIKWFQFLSDFGYNHIAKNRNFYYKLTISFFGKDPLNPKPYWFYYILILLGLIILL